MKFTFSGQAESAKSLAHHKPFSRHSGQIRFPGRCMQNQKPVILGELQSSVEQMLITKQTRFSLGMMEARFQALPAFSVVKFQRLELGVIQRKKMLHSRHQRLKSLFLLTVMPKQELRLCRSPMQPPRFHPGQHLAGPLVSHRSPNSATDLMCVDSNVHMDRMLAWVNRSSSLQSEQSFQTAAEDKPFFRQQCRSERRS